MRRIQFLLFFLLLFTFGYFQRSNPGWNVTSRLSLTLAMTEHQTFQIDHFMGKRWLHSGDTAYYQGHYYSDKIIGTSLLGIPAWYVVRIFEKLTDDLASTPVKIVWITFLTIGISGAAAGVGLFRWLVLLHDRNGLSNRIAAPLVSVLSLFLGTFLFGYGTLFMSYMPAICFFVWGGLTYDGWRFRTADGKLRGVLDSFAPLLAGLLFGLSILCEYLSLPAVGLFALYALWQTRRLTVAFQLGAGILIGIAPFLAYSYSIFGTISVPYKYHSMDKFREGMAKGIMGATIPNFHVLVLLTFHPYRGLFVQSPMLLAVFPGLFLMSRRPQLRPLMIVICVAMAVYFVYNSAYYMWWGGWASGPRHLAMLLPFLAIPVSVAAGTKGGLRVVALLSIPAVVMNLVSAATDPQIPDGSLMEFLQTPNVLRFHYPSPFMAYQFPALAGGRMDPNWGRFFGFMNGWTTLIPLLLVWAAAGAGFAFLLRQENGKQVQTGMNANL